MRLAQSQCYDAAGAMGGFERIWGLCEEVEALRGMRGRKRRLREYWACMAVLKLCIFDLLLTSSRLLLLAKAPRHAQIRLLASSIVAPALRQPCSSSMHAHMTPLHSPT